MAFVPELELLRAAVIDGRTDNFRYRQTELHSLHAALRNSADAIVAAISKDSCGESSKEISVEAWAEYCLTMDAITRLYKSLNFEQSMKDEYQLANGIDNTGRQIGKGLVVIRPTNHTRFYSTICPLVTAIAAGNCACLEVRTLPKTTLEAGTDASSNSSARKHNVECRLYHEKPPLTSA